MHNFLTTLAAFFAAGLGFWLAVIGFNVGLLALAVHKRPGWASITFVALPVFLHVTHTTNIPVFIHNHPWWALAYVGGYIIGAFVYAVVQWHFKTTDAKNKYRELRTRFLMKYQVKGTEVPVSLRKEWIDERKRHPEVELPKRIDYKDDIICWMAYWPWELLWSLVGDYLRRVFERLYAMTGKVFDDITDRAQREYDRDLQSKE